PVCPARERVCRSASWGKSEERAESIGRTLCLSTFANLNAQRRQRLPAPTRKTLSDRPQSPAIRTGRSADAVGMYAPDLPRSALLVPARRPLTEPGDLRTNKPEGWS